MKCRHSVALALVGVFAVSGCGIAAKVQARDDMMQAKDEYTACLRANSSEPQKCAGLKEAYQADLQAYRATAAGIRPGYSVSVDQSAN
jgi:hypothetical protein